MGYYTHFEIIVNNNEIIDKEIHEKLCEISGYNDWDYWTSSITGHFKWYENEHDMYELSMLFPDKVFTVTGNGEESNDIWRNYWKNGKFCDANRRIVYDEYDESKLEEWN